MNIDDYLWALSVVLCGTKEEKAELAHRTALELEQMRKELA